MQALTVALELSRRGHDVTFLCPRDSTPARMATRDGVAVRTVPDGKWHYARALKETTTLLGSENWDVVHTHLSHDLWTLVPAMGLSRSGARLFLTKHMASGVRKRDPLHVILYRRVDRVFAVSRYIMESVLATCPVSREDVRLLPNGVSLDRFSPSRHSRQAVRKELGICQDEHVVGMIGRMTPGKGHAEFLEAARLLASSGRRIIFLVVGAASRGEEAYERKIRALARSLGLEGGLIFTGFREDTPALLSAMDVLAFPSHEESFGITLLEAMAMHVPVVAARSAGVLDVVVDGETGLFFTPGDSKGLADAIACLVSDGELCRRLANQARRRVEDTFSIDSVVTALLDEYEAAIRPAVAPVTTV